MFSVQAVTAATDRAVTTDEAKTHLRVTHDLDDRYIDGLIDVATVLVETFTNRALMTRTLKVSYDCFDEYLILPMAPVSAVSWVKYYDPDDTLQTLATNYYQYDLDATPVEVAETAALGYWPQTRAEKIAAVQIQFVAGYASRAAIPANFKMAILLMVADMYWNRTPQPAPSTITSAELLVYPYKIWM